MAKFTIEKVRFPEKGEAFVKSQITDVEAGYRPTYQAHS